MRTTQLLCISAGVKGRRRGPSNVQRTLLHLESLGRSGEITPHYRNFKVNVRLAKKQDDVKTRFHPLIKAEPDHMHSSSMIRDYWTL